jgi:hypothetical protein
MEKSRHRQYSTSGEKREGFFNSPHVPISLSDEDFGRDKGQVQVLGPGRFATRENRFAHAVMGSSKNLDTLSAILRPSRLLVTHWNSEGLRIYLSVTKTDNHSWPLFTIQPWLDHIESDYLARLHGMHCPWRPVVLWGYVLPCPIL